MKSDSNRPITLEDLLRLKRAERPPGEFWGEFDRKLREKQLAALVAKRPWWQRLPQLVPALSRYRVALGATAVVALTFVSLRDTSDEVPVQVAGEPAAAPSAAAFEAVAAAATVAVETSDLNVNTVEVPATAVLARVERTESAVAPVEVDVVSAPRDVARMVALGGGTVAEAAEESLSPASRVIASNLAELRSSDPTSTARLLGGGTGFEARAMPTRVTVEPLQQITPPSESRRSRLLTAMVSTAAIEASARSTERAVSRLEEERLYDQSQRFGAKGDRFHVRF
jgi:hypothetical protein